MESASRHFAATTNHAASHRRRSSAAARRCRRAPRPKDSAESSFEIIVGCCVAPAALAFQHLDETSIYSHDFAERNFRLALVYFALAEMAVGLCIGSVVWCVLKGIALALRKVQRPKYYPQERLRRQALARERRRVRRRVTINAAPTPEDLLTQWAKVKESPEEMIRFGSMLCDLEAYVDNSLLRNENGEIVGRNPGIRGWLNANCQPLAVHYKTVMGYKAMAERFRQAIGLADPYPAALALDGCKNTVRNSIKRKAREMLAECGRSQRGVKIALAMRLSPDLVPPEVEQEERRRQGLPSRDDLARRFVQVMA